MKKFHFLTALLVMMAGVLPISVGTVSAAALPELSLINQTFNVRTTTQMRFTFSDDARFLDNPIEIELHRRVASRRSFQAIARGVVRPGVVDALTITPAQLRRNDGNVEMTVPISARVDTPQVIYLASDGIYPITIRIRHRLFRLAPSSDSKRLRPYSQTESLQSLMKLE
jgi:hypothetical protein